MNYSDYNPLLPSSSSSQAPFQSQSQQRYQPQSAAQMQQQRHNQQRQPQFQQRQQQPVQRQPQRQQQQPQRQPQQQKKTYSNIDPSKPMLFYSVNCKYSSLFLNYLSKNKMLQSNFTCIQIDPDPRTRQRTPIFYQIQMLLQKSITSVPTLVLDGKYTLSGKQAFKWLEDTLNENSEVKGFNIFEMEQISDKYADLHTDISQTDQIHLDETVYDPLTGQYIQKQNFKFLGEREAPIATPEDLGDDRNESQYKNQRANIDNILQGQKKMKLSFGDSDTGDSYSNMKKEREVHQIQRKQIDFTDSNLGLSGKIGDSVRGAKRSEVDNRFQELQAMRDSDVPNGPGVSENEIQQFIKTGRM